MKTEGWRTQVLSDLDFEHLVAELYFNGQFLMRLDREDGPDEICVSIQNLDGKLGIRIPLREFIDQVRSAADDLAQ